MTSEAFLNLILSITSLSPGIRNILTLSLSSLACGSNAVMSLKNEEVIRKDIEKVEKFVESLQSTMEERNITELKYFLNLNFPSEIYSVIEEIIKEAVNVKGSWTRKLASQMIVTIGSEDEPTMMNGKRMCLDILKELNETDIKLLALYEIKIKAVQMNKSFDNNKCEKSFCEIREDILDDEYIFSQSILSSSIKLANLGLINESCGLTPYDGENKNKEQMLENFLRQTWQQPTPHYKILQKYLRMLA